MLTQTSKGTRYLTAPEAVIVAATRWTGADVELQSDFIEPLFPVCDELDYFEDDPLVSDEGGDGAQLAKFAGQLCYLSFGAQRTRNSEAAKYLEHIKASGHGSVFEHANYSLLLWGVSRAFTHELVRHRAGFGFCLAGDTEIWSGSQQKGRFDGIKRKWTIRELFEKTNTSHGRSRIKLMRVRSFDGSFIVPNTIKAVFESGVKPIYKLSLEDGCSIRASEDHRFLTSNGWLPLRDISCGTFVATNGAVWTPEMREAARQKKLGDKNHRWRGDAASPNAGRQRANKLFSSAGRLCAFCGASSNLHRHHRDGNPLNNQESNIEIICARCHQHEHHLGRRLTVKWSKVCAVVRDGNEQTYDIEVGAPHHNFVANGIITHNSQVSQRYVAGRHVRFVESPAHSFYPELHAEFEAWIDQCAEQYQRREQILLRVSGIDPAKATTEQRKAVRQEARRCLPNETEAPILVTGNLRAWRHMIEQRASRFADAEICSVAYLCFQKLREHEPMLWSDYTVETVREDGLPTVQTQYRKV